MFLLMKYAVSESGKALGLMLWRIGWVIRSCIGFLSVKRQGVRKDNICCV